MSAAKFSDLVDMQKKACEQHANRDLFGTKADGVWKWTTYKEFGERVDNFRGGLAQLGIGKGDAVAIISGNRVEWAVAGYAAYGLGEAVTASWLREKEALVTRRGEFHWYLNPLDRPVCTEIWVHKCVPDMGNHWGFSCGG